MSFTRFRSFLRSRYGALALLLVWMLVIFTFSTLPGKETAGPPPLWYFIERKGAHVVEYAILMLLSYRFFRRSFYQESLVSILFLAGTFALMYGMTDELHQFFVPGRGARLTDVLIDGVGILLAALTLFLFARNKNRS